jgi:hypothetical protein
MTTEAALFACARASRKQTEPMCPASRARFISGCIVEEMLA